MAQTTNTATESSYVVVHYKGTLEDGTEFDNSRRRGEPISFTLGTGKMIPGFESAIIGMTNGETKTVTIPSTEAYGEKDEEAYALLSRSDFPDDFPLEAGAPVPLTGPGGQPMMGSVVEETDEGVKVDVNHPLAGKDLTFAIDLLAVIDDTETFEFEDSDS